MNGGPFSDAADRLGIEAADLDAAVAEGILTSAQAAALVAFAERRRARPSPTLDEEDVRLVTSFNDVFVVIGIALSVGSIVGLGVTFAPFVAAPLVAVLAWGLSEIFARRRRMALPSLVLTGLFTVAAGASVVPFLADRHGSTVPLAAGLVAVVAAAAHWRRFRVPIGMAALTAGGVAAAVGLVVLVAPNLLETHLRAVLFVAGLAVFAFAMRWDVSDLERRTRRSDVAFWLHVLAAPLLVHPLAGFSGAEFLRGPTSPLPAIAMFAVLAGVAIVVDRRALLVSGLAYFGGSILVLIEKSGWSGEVVGAVTVGVVGTSIIVLSIAWTPLRDHLLRFVPASVRAVVPAPRAIRGFSS